MHIFIKFNKVRANYGNQIFFFHICGIVEASQLEFYALILSSQETGRGGGYIIITHLNNYFVTKWLHWS